MNNYQNRIETLFTIDPPSHSNICVSTEPLVSIRWFVLTKKRKQDNTKIKKKHLASYRITNKNVWFHIYRRSNINSSTRRYSNTFALFFYSFSKQKRVSLLIRLMTFQKNLYFYTFLTCITQKNPNPL